MFPSSTTKLKAEDERLGLGEEAKAEETKEEEGVEETKG